MYSSIHVKQKKKNIRGYSQGQKKKIIIKKYHFYFIWICKYQYIAQQLSKPCLQ